MSKLNVNLNLSAYQDSNPTNNPMQSVIRWTRQISGLSITDPSDSVLSLGPGETKSLFSGARSLNSDITTGYDLFLKPGTSSTYVLKHTSGTAPFFRNPGFLGSDSSTEIAVSKSANLVTLTHVGGTDPQFSANAAPGDFIFLGDVFNSANQGAFKILSVSASSLSIENANGLPETVTLGVGFPDNFRVFGAAGVQAGDRLLLGSDFILSSGVYDVTYAQDNLVEFYFTGTLPEVSDLTTEDVVVYSTAKKMVYLESSQKVSVSVNGVAHEISPLGSNPAMFLMSGNVHSLSVTNSESTPSQIYVASVE